MWTPQARALLTAIEGAGELFTAVEAVTDDRAHAARARASSPRPDQALAELVRREGSRSRKRMRNGARQGGPQVIGALGG